MLSILLVIAAQAFHTSTYPDATRGRYRYNSPDEMTGVVRIVAESDPTASSVAVYDRRVSGIWPLVQYGQLHAEHGAADLRTITDRRLFALWRNEYWDPLLEINYVRPYAIWYLLIHPVRIVVTLLGVLAFAAGVQRLTVIAQRLRERRRLARGECLHCRYPIRAASASE